MARLQAVQSNFRTGQISPLMQGYIDLPDYQNALKRLENFVVLPQASVSRRPGTKYVNTTYSNSQSRLIPFNFGQGESYVLEFSAGRIRIFYNNPSTNEPELIPNGGGDSSVGLTTYTDINGTSQSIPYLASELEEINWAQSADTMFLAHPNHPPLRLKRAGLNIDDWSIDEFPFKNGPFLPVNNQLTWLRPSDVDDADYVDSKIGEIPNSTNYILASTDALTLANHGLVNSEIVYLDNNVPSGSLVAGTNYYVVQATTNTFKLSTEIDGEPVSITGTGSGSDPIHVHQRSITEGATITLTALKGTKIEGCVFNQASASPANKFVTTAAHSLGNGDVLQFKTGNVDGFSVDVDYYVVNSSTTEFQLASTFGGSAITVTGSDTVPVGGLYKLEESADHINDGAGFTSSDVGRLVRLDTAVQPKIKWGYGRITAVAATTEITLHVLEDLSGVNDTQSWALGAFSDTTGYPRTVAIYQQRMIFAGTSEEPQSVHFSKTGDFDNFSTTEPLGELTGTAVGGTAIFGEQIYDDNALTLAISSDTVDRIVFLSAQEQLIVGTTGGIFQMFGARDDITITPFNFSVVKVSAWNAAVARPVEIGSNVIYIQQSGRKLRELEFSRQGAQDYGADDLTLRAEDITFTSIKEAVYQDQPNALVWCRRGDGKLACMTYVNNIPIIAWHLHTIGGTHSDATYGDHAKVESIAVIPQTDHDQLWMVVKRHIIELDTPLAGLTFDMTNGVFTSVSPHGLSDGDELVFETVPSDMANFFVEELVYFVVNSDSTTFQLSELASGSAINPNDAGGSTSVAVNDLSQTVTSEVRYVEVMQKFYDLNETEIDDAWFVDSGKKTTGSDLSSVTVPHLNGQTLSFLGDGAPQPDKQAHYSNGYVALSGTDVADTVIAGFGYESNLETLPLAVGDRQFSSIGQRKRVHRIIIGMLETMGLKYGTEDSNLYEEDFRTTADFLNQPVPLFSGMRELVTPSAYTRTGEIYIRQDQALPFTVTFVAMDYETND